MKLTKNSIYFDHTKSDQKPDFKSLFDMACLVSDPKLDKLQQMNLSEDNFYIMPTTNIKSECPTDLSTDCQLISPVINKKFYRYDVSVSDQYILPVPIYAQRPVFFYLWEVFHLFDCGLKTDNPIQLLVVTDILTLVDHNDTVTIIPDILYCVQEYRRKITNKIINDANHMVCITDSKKDLDQTYVQLMFVRHKIDKIGLSDDLKLTHKSDLIICWLTNHKFVLDSLSNLNLGGTLIIYLETDLDCVNSHSQIISALTNYFSKVICYIPECAKSTHNFMIVICQKLLIDVDIGVETILPPTHIIDRLKRFIGDRTDIINIHIQKINELDNLFKVTIPKTWLLYLFHVRNQQIKFAINWCKKFKMQMHPFYTIVEADPVLLHKPINFAKIFPPADNVDRSKLMMTDIGLYSITPYIEADTMVDIIAKHIAKSLDKLIITESNGGLGGNTIAFAKRFLTVNTVEYSNLHCDILRHNIKIYGYQNVNLYCTSYLNVFEQLQQDIVFMDPPWFGPGYKYAKKLYLYIGEYLIEDIINMIKSKIKLLVLKVPFNYDIDYFKKRIKYKTLVVHRIKNYQMLMVDFQ